MLPQQPVKFGTGVKKPKEDLHVVVKRSEEWKGVTWSYFMGGEVDFAKLSNAEQCIWKVRGVADSAMENISTTGKKMRVTKFSILIRIR